MARTAGPKGAKSSTLSLRLTSRTRYGLTLLARVSHMSLGQVVEAALEAAFYGEGPGTLQRATGGSPGRIPVLDATWDERPWVRLAKLGMLAPEMLSRSELMLWNALQQKKGFWTQGSVPKDVGKLSERMAHDAIAEAWSDLAEQHEVAI